MYKRLCAHTENSFLQPMKGVHLCGDGSDPKCKHIPCEEEKAADSKYTCAKLDKWISGYHVRFDKSDATLHDNYAAFGNAFYSPMGCIAKHAKQWEWTGSAMLRMGKQLNQGKGWHYGTYTRQTHIIVSCAHPHASRTADGATWEGWYHRPHQKGWDEIC